MGIGMETKWSWHLHLSVSISVRKEEKSLLNGEEASKANQPKSKRFFCSFFLTMPTELYAANGGK